MTKLSELPEVPGGPQAGDEYYTTRSNGDSPETFTGYRAAVDKMLAYDFGFAFGDAPEAGSVIQRVRIGRDIVIPANMAGASGGVDTNPDATWAVDVQDDGVSIGTISVSTGGVVTLTTTGGTAKRPRGAGWLQRAWAAVAQLVSPCQSKEFECRPPAPARQ